MTVMTLTGKDTEDNEQAYGAFRDAELRSLEAIHKYPALKLQPHLDNVKDVKSEVIGVVNFRIQNQGFRGNSKSSNFYENQRESLGGEIAGPGTALKFRCQGQRNFTQSNAQTLQIHLKSVLSTLKINVLFSQRKPEFVVHVGL